MFQVGLFDESQMVKNASTKRGRAVQHIPGLKRTYIITGTMMTNYVQDTFWQLNMLFKGKFPVLGQLKDYTTCKGHKKGQEQFLIDFQSTRGDKKRLPHLRNKEAMWGMMSSVQIRRRATDPEVDQQIELPELSLHTELIEMDEDHEMIYRMKTGAFQQELAASLRAAGQDVSVSDLSLVDIEQQINILRMTACAPEIEPAYRREMTNKDARILELIEQGLQKGTKTVVFSSFRAFTEKMEEMCKERDWDPIMIDGTIPIPNRWPLIDEWRTSADRKVMIAGIKSMNYAVNFTAACEDFGINQVIFATPEWVPTEMEQAWKRVHRIGQTSPVQTYFIYLKDTVEAYMDDVLYQKRRTIATAMDRIEDLQREDDKVERSATEIAQMILDLGKVA
jgi:SNF2 family DNA or RNA helicase